MDDSNVQIEEVYKRVPFFPTNWDDYNKCPVCNSVLKNGKKRGIIRMCEQVAASGNTLILYSA